jgi:hypothetical protein
LSFIVIVPSASLKATRGPFVVVAATVAILPLFKPHQGLVDTNYRSIGQRIRYSYSHVAILHKHSASNVGNIEAIKTSNKA